MQQGPTNIGASFLEMGVLAATPPAPDAGGVQLYIKTVAGAPHVFYQTSGGTVDITDTLATLTTGVGASLAKASNLSDLANIATAMGNLSAAARSQTAEFISGYISVPANQDYRLIVKSPHAGTITETTTRCVSGTCTATFKVNTTALGGTANSVSSSAQSQAQSSTNTFAAGDDIVVTISSNSACIGMSFTIKYSRTLA
jgi:hypothetical protein